MRDFHRVMMSSALFAVTAGVLASTVSDPGMPLGDEAAGAAAREQLMPADYASLALAQPPAGAVRPPENGIGQPRTPSRPDARVEGEDEPQRSTMAQNGNIGPDRRCVGGADCKGGGSADESLPLGAILALLGLGLSTLGLLRREYRF